MITAAGVIVLITDIGILIHLGMSITDLAGTDTVVVFECPIDTDGKSIADLDIHISGTISVVIMLGSSFRFHIG